MVAPKIAVIGLEASGKTVLMTVLAKKLSQTIHQGYFLDPKGVLTIKYIESVWNTLQNLDWPPSTPPGEMFNLCWALRVTPEFSKNGKSYEAELHLLDAAGQDMRQLFAYDNTEDIPEYLRPLAEYYKQADILLIALNIYDYVGKTVDQMCRIENQATIKAALDMLQKSNQRVAIIFTQMDKYYPFVEQKGGLDNFCKNYLPYIYNAYVANSSNSLISVAAVNDTVTVEKEEGKQVLVPKPNFSSFGLEDVCNWLAKQVVEISEHEAKTKGENVTIKQTESSLNYQLGLQTPQASSNIRNPQVPSLETSTKQCPFCGETILAEALRCRYCKSDLPSQMNPINVPKPENHIGTTAIRTNNTELYTALIIGAALIIGGFSVGIAIFASMNHRKSSYPSEVTHVIEDAPTYVTDNDPVEETVYTPPPVVAPKPEPNAEIYINTTQTLCDHDPNKTYWTHLTRLNVDTYNPGKSGNFLITATISVSDNTSKKEYTRTFDVYLTQGSRKNWNLDFNNVCSRYTPFEAMNGVMKEGEKQGADPLAQLLGGVIGAAIANDLPAPKNIKVSSIKIERQLN